MPERIMIMGFSQFEEKVQIALTNNEEVYPVVYFKCVNKHNSLERQLLWQYEVKSTNRVYRLHIQFP